MIARTTLEAASFWAQDVCIECETIQPAEDDTPEDEQRLCCSCGGLTLLPAETILQIADMVGED